MAKASGVGEFALSVDGPVTQPVSSTFLLPTGPPRQADASPLRRAGSEPERLAKPWLLSRAVISDHFANSLENIMRNRNSTPQNSKNPHAKWAAKPPFLVPFFRVLGGGIPVSHNIFRGISKIIIIVVGGN